MTERRRNPQNPPTAHHAAKAIRSAAIYACGLVILIFTVAVARGGLA